jgi:hypothetical protein
MDELTMVRGLLDEREPSPEVVAAGRERLLSKRPLRRRRPLVPALAAVAVAAAVVVVAMLLPAAGSSPRGGGGGPFVDTASARSVLLAAAVHAESAPATGTYWHIRSLTTTTLEAHGYTLEHLSVREEWARRDGRAWSGTRDWVRPSSPRDEAAWRRDGAPDRWCFGRTDTQPPRPDCLRTAPGTASLTRNHFPFEVAEGQDLTFAQLQRLPDGPEALRAWLVRVTREDLDPSASAGVVDVNVIQILANLLVYPPVPPGVRAAAFRSLADMPGVKSIGRTRDALGRSGVGIRITQHGRWLVPAGRPGGATPVGEVTRTLLVDPATSRVLADRTRVGNRSDAARDTLILSAGWTDEAPREPALPRRS